MSALGPTGAEGQLPVLQEGCRGPRNRAGGPKELLENVSSSQKALALDSDSHFPAWQEKENPPEIRPVVIWKIIANIFHPPGSSLCVLYVLFHKILTHLMKWVLFLLLFKLHFIGKKTEVEGIKKNCPGAHR